MSDPINPNDPKLVAIHEASHLVARIVEAERLGVPDNILYVVVRRAGDSTLYTDPISGRTDTDTPGFAAKSLPLWQEKPGKDGYVDDELILANRSAFEAEIKILLAGTIGEKRCAPDPSSIAPSQDDYKKATAIAKAIISQHSGTETWMMMLERLGNDASDMIELHVDKITALAGAILASDGWKLDRAAILRAINPPPPKKAGKKKNRRG